MKPFRFPLQAVRTVRLDQESKALESFARAQAEVERIAARLRQIRSEIEDAHESHRATLRTAASSDDLQRLQLGLRALQDHLQESQAESQKAQAVREEKSRALLEARQQREVVDKLHDKQFAKHQVHAARIEQKALDDLATLKSIGNFALKWR